MAVLTHLETDTGTNVDISSATAVGAYTANGDKLIMVDVSIDAVAGNGDYVMYVTRQIGGSGSAYRILPQTTMTAASGLTAISGQSGWITVRNGDVLTCYVDGLAGDTSTPDWTTRWFESAVTLVTLADDAITASKFDESTAFPLKSADTGATQVARVGANSDTLETLSDEIAAVKAETAAILADTGTDGVVVASGQTVATVTNLTNLPTMPADWVTASGLKADAVTEIQSGLAKTTDIPSDYAKAGDAMTLTAAYDNAKDDVLTPLATVDSIVDAIKAKTDNLPASPAATGDAMTLTSAYDAAKTAATQTSVNAIPTAPLLAANYTAPDNAGITAIKAKTDNLPADPADDSDIDAQLAAIKTVVDAVLVDTGTTIPATLTTIDNFIDTEVAAILEDTNEIQAELADGGRTDLLIDAIKAKTDVIPASPAPANEYDARMTAIQAELDNPDQYKADVSGLATAAALDALDGKVDTVDDVVDTILVLSQDIAPAIAAVKSVVDDILVDTGTTLDGKLNTIDTNVDSILADTGTDGVKIASGELSTVATASSITALDGKIDTIDNFLDTEVAAILADTNEIQAELADGGRTDLLIDAIKAKTDLMDASAITYTPNVVGTAITLLRGDTFTATMTDIGALTGYVSIDFTVKRNTSNTDDEAVIRIRKNASGTGDGLLRLNGAAPITETGEIVIDDEATGDIIITLDETATDSLEIGAYLYDVQLITATAVKTLTSGRLNVTSDVTRAIA